MKTFLNFALALILISTVSLTKLRLATKIPIPNVTFRGSIKAKGTSTLVPQSKLGSAKIEFVSDSGTYNAKIVGDGTYEVTLPIGRYRRTVTVSGFKPVETKICVRPGASSENPKNGVYLDEVPVPVIIKPIEKKIIVPTVYSIRGLVKDSTSNKVISDTSISITFINTATNDTYKATVLTGGLYSVSNLAAGKYKIVASLNGFAEFSEIRQILASSDELNPINTILLSPVISGESSPYLGSNSFRS